MGQPIAHSRNRRGERQPLLNHLQAVAIRAELAAEKFGAGTLGYWAGIWHDIGKFHPDFQRYLLDAEAEPTLRRRGPDHKAAGAVLAMDRCPPLAHLIAGHHGGLRDQQGKLLPWLREHQGTSRISAAIALADDALDPLLPSSALEPPAFVASGRAAEFFIRMLFSALVDADFLDTESHFSPEREQERGGVPSINDLWATFEREQSTITGRNDDQVNRVRHEVYRACVAAADSPPGFFRLTVPTGGGKTRSGLAFALRHALAHDLDRVIVAIPYTSITDQTAAVYRRIFDDPRAVLEHHSAIQRRDDEEGFDSQWERLAAENWDAPVVVTTTVQFFESLFGRTTSACRKLHNIARSVVILDEVQTLPEHLLAPILDGLRELVAHYATTVVLSTATQPALDERAAFRGLPDVREIIPDPPRLFRALQRVTFDWVSGRDGAWTWERVAAEMLDSPQAMTIVNTKRDALALLDALQPENTEGLFHLSTLLCGAHRRDVLTEVRRRLAAGEPCRLVATQVVEAGVDIDFPLVLRAVGPLDRIVQAAGRCNREGRLERGRVVIFQPADGGLPRGAYATGTTATAALLASGDADLHDPATYRRYFSALYARVDLDPRRIQQAREHLDYSVVADRFRLIEDDTASVLVRYHEQLPDGGSIDTAISALRGGWGNRRLVWRSLQPLLVGVRAHALHAYERDDLVTEIVPGLWEWGGRYDRLRGLVESYRDAAELVI